MVITEQFQTNVHELRKQVTGRVVLPYDQNYDADRQLYNAMIDKRPALIVKCASKDDIIHCIRFAKENALEIAIRSGGHNGPGFASVDGGLVIDLSAMKEIRVDKESQTVHVEAGCTWAEVDSATHEYGLATVSGIIGSTGVGGLTLGGGHGYLTRQHGLTIDNLLEAEVVLADGQVVTANEYEYADLFWALRGGGGNFGVVSAFTFRLHPVHTVIAGPMFWTLDKTEQTMKWYRDWLPDAPEEIGTFYLIAEVPSADPFPREIWGEKVCGLMWFYTGSDEKFESLVQEAREIADPLFEFTAPMPYTAVQTMFDGLFPAGLQWYWKGDFVHELTDEAIREHCRYAEVPTSLSAMHLYPLNGAVHRVDSQETAWNMRDANWSMVIVAVDPDPVNNERMSEWARAYWKALRPYNQHGGYVNFMMDEGRERIQTTYGKNYEKLRKIKAKYDPENFFHINQNIAPANSSS